MVILLLLLLLQLLLLSIQSIWRDDQVFNLFGRQVATVLDVIAGVDGAVVGEAAGAVGRVNVRLVAAQHAFQVRRNK
jgi:hypothetical protein